jgi:hypothetical protein
MKLQIKKQKNFQIPIEYYTHEKTILRWKTRCDEIAIENKLHVSKFCLELVLNQNAFEDCDTRLVIHPILHSRVQHFIQFTLYVVVFRRSWEVETGWFIRHVVLLAIF